MRFFRSFVIWLYERKSEIVFSFNNYILNSIPFWPIRKMFYKFQGMKIGKGSRIMMKTHIVCPNKICIGNHTYINEYCFLDGRGGIEIGDNVTIAVYSKLITGGHKIDDERFDYKEGKIVIGNNVAIFADCIVLSDVKIEDGCVFSAGTVARKGKYTEKGIYAGNPAKYIRKRKSQIKYKQNFWFPIFR